MQTSTRSSYRKFHLLLSFSPYSIDASPDDLLDAENYRNSTDFMIPGFMEEPGTKAWIGKRLIKWLLCMVLLVPAAETGSVSSGTKYIWNNSEFCVALSLSQSPNTETQNPWEKLLFPSFQRKIRNCLPYTFTSESHCETSSTNRAVKEQGHPHPTVMKRQHLQQQRPSCTNGTDSDRWVPEQQKLPWDSGLLCFKSPGRQLPCNASSPHWGLLVSQVLATD